MKRKLLSLLFVVLVCNLASAQKFCDLELGHAYPANNALIPYGDTIPVVTTIKNLGPDPITTSDTIRYLWNINPVGRVVIADIPVGSTLSDTFLTVWADNVPQDNIFAFCNFMAQSQIGFSDTSKHNDTSCISMILQGNHISGVNEVPPAYTTVTVFPNPTTDFINITLPAAFGSKAEVIIYDMRGSIVGQQSCSTGKGGKRNVFYDAGKLSGGLYIIKVKSESGLLQGKFLKQ
jgi:hypothetical protein